MWGGRLLKGSRPHIAVVVLRCVAERHFGAASPHRAGLTVVRPDGAGLELARSDGHLGCVGHARAIRRCVSLKAFWRGWKFREENMKKSDSNEGQSASERIDKRIAELGDWRGETLSRMRKLIKQADPDVVEEVKWVKATSPGTPTWSHDGIICTGESYKSVVKLTFAKGASLKDPAKLFNSSLEGNTRRAIDIHEGEKVDAGAFKALIRAAVALNTSGGKARPRRAK